ncbi:MAG: carbohydrate kinase [Cyanobacteria bacterium P01_C01_bin.89]
MPVPQVLCVGEMLWDCLGDSAENGGAKDKADSSNVGSAAPDPSKIENWTAYPGGAPANVACALPKLGVQSALISCLGQDAAGDRLLKILQQGGVNIDGIQRHPAPTREVYVVRDGTGDRQFVAFGAEGKGEQDTTAFADTQLLPASVPQPLFSSAKFLTLGTLALAYPNSGRAIAHALDLADQYYVPVFLDLNWRPLFWPDPSKAQQTIAPILERVDLLKLSKEEALWMFATDDPAAIAQKLDHLEGVIITDGANGCRYCLGGHMGDHPGFKAAVVDTTGAGDGFVAGFLSQLLQGGLKTLDDPKRVYRMVVYASAVGALVTQKSGAIAAQPNRTEVENFLRQQGLIA